MIAIVSIFLTDKILAQPRIGVLIGSYGDIDDVETELRPFIRNTLTDPDILPLPAWLRATIADAGWYIERRKIKAQYAAIGGRTDTRQRSRDQVTLVAEALKARGIDAYPYVGFTMTSPFVASAMETAQKDGIETLYVLYQGAQYAHDTAQILFRHVQHYLRKNPQWPVKVVGIRSFSDDRRFVDLVGHSIERRLATDLGAYGSEDICLFLSAHGNVIRGPQESDPYMSQVMGVIRRLEERFAHLEVSYGFHNHDEIPGVPWSQPSNEKSIKSLAKKSCQAVLVNGQISFTVDNLETLYNQAVEIPAVLADETARLKIPPKKVVVDGIFNSDRDFVQFLADLVEEAERGQGDLVDLNQPTFLQ
jgi:ferrochelatase